MSRHHRILHTLPSPHLVSCNHRLLHTLENGTLLLDAGYGAEDRRLKVLTEYLTNVDG